MYEVVIQRYTAKCGVRVTVQLWRIETEGRLGYLREKALALEPLN
jgi:hypothetical protein